MRVFITGGAGYVGSHATTAALRRGYDVLVYDNLCNSSEDRVRQLTACGAEVWEGDILDDHALYGAMKAFRPDRILHLAALKYAEDSGEVPLTYWQTNVAGTIEVCRAAAMLANKPLIVFSSTAAVYGEMQFDQFREWSKPRPTSVYGQTKVAAEQVLDAFSAETGVGTISLRYFNVAGGEFPERPPRSLFTAVARAAMGGEELTIYGSNFRTPDGTGVRDYVHVMDVAEAHLEVQNRAGHRVYNVGTGQGLSVLDIVAEFESVLGRYVPRQWRGQRPSDVAASVANCDYILADTGWKPKRTLRDMVEDTLRHAHRDMKEGFWNRVNGGGVNIP